MADDEAGIPVSESEQRDDDLFAQVAVNRLFITPLQARTALKQQVDRFIQGSFERLSDILLENDILTGEDVAEINTIMKRSFVRCPGCASVFNVDDLKPGRTLFCQQCKLEIPVPGGEEDAVEGEEGPAEAAVPELDQSTVGLVGKTLGGCRVEEMIGRGGASAVYKAIQLSLQRLVALKVLPAAVSHDENSIRRFEREASVIASLSHPNIVQVHNRGWDEAGFYFITMEYMHGGPVADRLKEPLAEDVALRYAADAAGGLVAAHRENILHRNIKPDNLLLDKYDRVKIADFGLGAVMEGSMPFSASVPAMGTPSTMAPERGEGREADVRSDIYSLGATLYILLTGEPPCKGHSPLEVMKKHIEDPVPDVADVNPDVSPETRDLVRRAMAKSPGDRFQTADDFLHAIEGVLSSRRAGALPSPARGTPPGPAGATIPPGAKPGSGALETEARPVWTSRLLLAGAAVALLALAFLCSSYLFPGGMEGNENPGEDVTEPSREDGATHSPGDESAGATETGGEPAAGASGNGERESLMRTEDVRRFQAIESLDRSHRFALLSLVAEAPFALRPALAKGNLAGWTQSFQGAWASVPGRLAGITGPEEKSLIWFGDPSWVDYVFRAAFRLEEGTGIRLAVRVGEAGNEVELADPRQPLEVGVWHEVLCLVWGEFVVLGRFREGSLEFRKILRGDRPSDRGGFGFRLEPGTRVRIRNVRFRRLSRPGQPLVLPKIDGEPIGGETLFWALPDMVASRIADAEGWEMSGGILRGTAGAGISPVGIGSPAWRRFRFDFSLRNLKGRLRIIVSRFDDLQDFGNRVVQESRLVLEPRHVAGPGWIPCRIDVTEDEVRYHCGTRQERETFERPEKEGIPQPLAFALKGARSEAGRVEIKDLSVRVLSRTKGY